MSEYDANGVKFAMAPPMFRVGAAVMVSMAIAACGSTASSELLESSSRPVTTTAYAGGGPPSPGDDERSDSDSEPAVLPSPPRALLVGDSTLLAVETYAATDGLQGFSHDLDVASCRTLGVASCGEPPRPPNAVETIRAATGPYDIVVVMAGYDEWWTSFPQSLEQVAAAAREVGSQTLLFLNFREGFGYVAPDGRIATEAFERNNETLERIAGSGALPELVVADWSGYSAGDVGDDWLADDGIHLTPLGAWAVGDYISRWIAHLSGRPCPTMPDGPTCENPDLAPDRPSRDVLLPDP